MPDLRHDLLTKALLRVREPAGASATVSLAGALARLSRGEEIEFVALQPHQEHAWHTFLVQVAALALHRAGLAGPFQHEVEWRDVLRELAGGQAAWCLVVEDLGLPAFLQPPIPEGTLDAFSREHFPDDLDVLVTAKNHDVKRGRMARASPEHWAYLLASVQTTQGFSGRGNYGILRMNGGFGNRPHVAYAPGLGRAERFVRDVGACIDGRAVAADRVGFAGTGGIGLTWTVPWDGASSLTVEQLDPWFVETCRRIRLVAEGGRIVAFRRATDRPRVAPREGVSDTADPWTPVDIAKGTSLTTSAAGFGYDRTQELLFGGQFAMGAAGSVRAADGATPWFLAAALARGQGRTDGLHERRLRVPAPVRRLLHSPEGRDRFRERSKRWVNAAKVAKLNVLGPALSVLMGSGDGTKAARGRFLSALDAAIDGVFFERLWATAELSDTDADAAWARELVAPGDPIGLARSVLADAIATVPTRVANRYRAVAEAEGMFEGCARKRFPAAFSVQSGGIT